MARDDCLCGAQSARSLRGASLHRAGPSKTAAVVGQESRGEPSLTGPTHPPPAPRAPERSQAGMPDHRRPRRRCRPLAVGSGRASTAARPCPSRPDARTARTYRGGHAPLARPCRRSSPGHGRLAATKVTSAQVTAESHSDGPTRPTEPTRPEPDDRRQLLRNGPAAHVSARLATAAAERRGSPLVPAVGAVGAVSSTASSPLRDNAAERHAHGRFDQPPAPPRLRRHSRADRDGRLVPCSRTQEQRSAR